MKEATFTIRMVQSEDFEAIAALLNPYIEKTAIHFSTQPTTAEEQRAAWESSRHRYAFLVAVEENTLLGFAKAGVFRSRDAYQWSTELGVYVHEQHHRKGVARALYQRLIAVCEAQGFHLLVAGIALPNEASVALHEQFGFQCVGVFPEVGFKLGRFHSAGFWTRIINQQQPMPTTLRSPKMVFCNHQILWTRKRQQFVTTCNGLGRELL